MSLSAVKEKEQKSAKKYCSTWNTMSGNSLMLNRGGLMDFAERLMPPEMPDVADVLRDKPQAMQRELFRACGVLDWYEGKGELQPAKAGVIGYGGAAYGGKTYGLLLLVGVLAYAYPGIQITFFRRTYAELDGSDAAIPKARGIFAGIAKERDQGRHWIFEGTSPTSELRFRHCEYEKDVSKYQSQDFDVLMIDEATHFTWPIVDYLMTRNRVSSKIDTKGVFKPFAIMPTNPGGVGHGWYMGLFDLEGDEGETLEGAPEDRHLQVKTMRNLNEQDEKIYFIPSFMSDNKIGLERDPEYRERLRKRDPDLAEALEKGNWRIFSGQAFRDFDKSVHVCKPFDIPTNWPKWRAVDWGWDHPFCCLWFTRDPAGGRVYVYREVLKRQMTDVHQAMIISEYSPESEHIGITFADPSMWAKKNVEGVIMSAADQYAMSGVPLTKADNDRLSGKRKIHSLFANLADGRPGLMFFDYCQNLIRLFPLLARATTRPEDVEKMDGDDPYDTLRYGLTNVRMMRSRKKSSKMRIQETAIHSRTLPI